MTGLYQIRHVASGRRYIGSAVNVRLRLSYHVWLLRRGGDSIHLSRAWRKYGEAAFALEPLLVCAPADLLWYEQRAIDYYAARKLLLNVSRTAGSPLGYRHSPERRAKIAAGHRGLKHAAETKAKIGDANRRRVWTPEARAKVGAAAKGRLPRDAAGRFAKP